MVNSNECSVSSSLTGDAIECSAEKKTIFLSKSAPLANGGSWHDPIASFPFSSSTSDLMIGFAVQAWDVIPSHKSSEDGHDHFLLDFSYVLRQGVDSGSDLTRHGDGVLGVGQIVLVRVAFAHQIVVDGARLDAIDQVDDNTAIPNRRILLPFQTVSKSKAKTWIRNYLETSDGRALLAMSQFVVDPINDLLFDDRTARIGQLGQDRQSVSPHQLPDQGCTWNTTK